MGFSELAKRVKDLVPFQRKETSGVLESGLNWRFHDWSEETPEVSLFAKGRYVQLSPVEPGVFSSDDRLDKLLEENESDLKKALAEQGLISKEVEEMVYTGGDEPSGLSNAVFLVPVTYNHNMGAVFFRIAEFDAKQVQEFG